MGILEIMNIFFTDCVCYKPVHETLENCYLFAPQRNVKVETKFMNVIVIVLEFKKEQIWLSGFTIYDCLKAYFERMIAFMINCATV